jgi:NitT/TauT family transport system substrate-binding protein
VRVARGGALGGFPVAFGDKEGIFEKYGIEIEDTVLAPAVQLVSLTTGDVDFATAPSNALFDQINKGLDLVLVYPIGYYKSTAFIVSTKFAQEHNITKDTPIEEWIQSIPGSVGGLSSVSSKGYAALLLADYGFTLDDIKVATLPSVAANLAALQSGETDWMLTGQPNPNQLEEDGYGIVVGDRTNIKAWSPKVYDSVITVSRKFAQENPDVIRRFIAATKESIDAIQADMNHAAEVYSAVEDGKFSVTVASKTLALSGHDYDSHNVFTDETWEIVRQFGVKSGELDTDAQPLAEVHAPYDGPGWTNDFVN